MTFESRRECPEGAETVGGSSHRFAGHPPARDLGPVTVPLPKHLQSPVATLLASFDNPTPLGITVAREEPEDQAAFAVVHVQLQDGGGWGFGVDLSAAVPDVLQAIASGVQEHLPETTQAWAQPRPQCPSHSHEMVVQVVEGTALWVCPNTRAPIRAVL